MKAFSKIHPFVLITYFLIIITVSMFVSNPVIKLLSLAGAALFSFVITDRKERLENIKFYLPLALLIAVTNPIVSHNGETPLFFMNGNAVTLEAVFYGIDISVMIISVMLWFRSYSIVMTSDKFVYLFGRIMPRTALVISMAIRFVPMLKRRISEVSRVQKSMGLYSVQSLTDRLHSLVRVMSAVIGWSLESAVETSRSMKSRGYGLKGHSCYSDYKMTKNDIAVFAVFILLTAIMFSGASDGHLRFYFYPVISDLNTDFIADIAYSAFGILAFFPFLFEVEESIRWKYYRSKISALRMQARKKMYWKI